MFKIILFLLFLNFTYLSASESPCGTVCNIGTTFATEEYAREALRRGSGDPKNPFVDNVCLLNHSTEKGVATATITQVAPNIFLCCKHTATELSEATSYFEARGKTSELTLFIQSGEAILRGATLCVIRYHPDIDLALMRLDFIEGTIPACAFLPLAKTIDEEIRANGFAVSYGEVSVVEKAERLAFGRSVSIHPFTRKSEELVSSLSGSVDASRKSEMMEALSKFILDQSTENKKALAAIMQTASLRFPKATTSALQLMSVLGKGASGTPLVIKQEDEFRIAGILTRGAYLPKMDNSATVTLIGEVEYTANFLYLFPYNSWIQESVTTLMNSSY